MSAHVDTEVRNPHSEKPGYKLHIITFVLSMILTVLAFYSIASDTIPKTFAVPFMIVLAIVQAVFQAAFWMHLNQKGHSVPIVFILSGFMCALVTVFACGALIWW